MTHVVSLLNDHFFGARDDIFLDIDVPIFDTIICKFFFNTDAEDETIDHMIRVFDPICPSNGKYDTRYCKKINNLKLFNLVIGQVLLGSSFCLDSRNISSVCRELPMGYLSGCNEAKVFHCIRINDII